MKRITSWQGKVHKSQWREAEGDGCGENRTPPSYTSEKPARHREQPAVRLTWLPKRVQTAKNGKTFSSPRPSSRDPGCVQSGGGRTPLFITGATSFSPPVCCGGFIFILVGEQTGTWVGKKITERKFCSFSFLEYINSTKTTAPTRDPLWEE